MDLKAIIKPVSDWATKNAPSIMTGVSVAAGAGAVGTSIYETVKTVREFDALKTDEDNTKKKILIVAKRYWKPVVLVTVSAGCAIAANHVNLARNAALIAAYTLSDGKMKEYKEAVLKTVGEKKEEEIRDEVARNKIANTSQNSVIYAAGGEYLCYDSISGRYFRSSIEKVRAAVNEFNRRLTFEGSLSLNEFYDILGLDAISMGDDLGWDLNHGNREMLEMDYSSQLYKDEPCLVLEYNVQPQWWAFNQ